MHLLLASGPLAVSVLLILFFRQSAVRAGSAGLAVALLTVWLVDAFHLRPDAVGAAIGHGLLITLNVAYVLAGGIALYQVLQAGGALAVIAGRLADAVPDPGRRTLVLVLGLSVFFESATGFGIGIVVTAPLFLALGFDPRRAALLALLGQCAVPWGALSIGTILGAELFAVPAAQQGVLAAPLSLPLILVCGGAALWLTGGVALLRRRAVDMTVLALLLCGILAAGSHFIGVELAGCLAGLAVAAMGLLLGRDKQTGQQNAAAGPSLLQAISPLALLLVLLLLTRLIGPLQVWLQSAAQIDVPTLGFRLPMLYHPGFWLFVAAILSVPILQIPMPRVASIALPAARQWLIASAAIAGFICFSQVMLAAGMIQALAAATAAAVGPLYPLLVPVIGGAGGFLTASNAGSNAMFASFQKASAVALGLPVDIVAAAQNAAGANVTLASPGRVVLAASVTGLTGQEGTLMRPALAVAVANVAAIAAVLWFWL